MDKMDYTLAFEEVNTLNRLFANQPTYLLPALNPLRYTVVEDGAEKIIILGRLSEQYYAIGRSTYKATNGERLYNYTGAVHVRPTERIVIDWETV